ncbi:Pathogenic type III effector avirulence factor Avr cleavage site-containing protein [Rhynchospora pubera]|uniref:Pathogenic type III effector avirulence factor Avr cleavage site-containing protein n=1 Tax=Rhynchospora pubera TaxID=906938 RepID=A0AAV8HFX3_9POAL|nr:Pathogenic type III effector avirulence factor Avr cleavage site-containing protein [Rhynchospora pubera]
MEATKRCRIPAFGNWDSFDDVPISKCFESTVHTGLIHGHYFREYVSGDLLLVPLPTPVKPGLRIKRRQRKGFNEKRRQRKVYYAREDEQLSLQNKRIRSPKAVDEDLYKIPPEFLYQKPKLRNIIGSLWAWCLCIKGII